MNPIAEDMLMHYGVKRRSGRYPYGSGNDPYQRTGDLLSRYESLVSEGKSEKEIADIMGSTTTKLRVQLAYARGERRALQVDRAKSLRTDGKTLMEIADIMGLPNESSVRSLLNANSESRMKQAKTTADQLKKLVDEKGMLDVGVGVERELGISSEKLKEALYILEMEGYPSYGGRIDQVTNPGKKTTLKVLCPPGTEHKEIYNVDDINSVRDYMISYDGGDTFQKPFLYPESMSSKRLNIRYADDGGIDKDGVIELRRGVKDLDLGESHYAQVRILVDGDRYLKGMAVYSDDMPDGVDVVFNTNKKQGTDKRDVLKKISDDPDNPFGALIKEHGGQSYYVDSDGKKKLSLINKRADEGDWGSWNDKLPSQFLAKQNLSLIKKQLGLTEADKVAELDEILSLTNPTVKKTLLNSYANDCDAAAVHLKAAALPRQKYQVILPLTSIKDNEVYAPNYEHGETVALVRFPHGGTFEIPILKVNTKNVEGKKVIGKNPLDAIGINMKVADRLSGADFDGDTVMVIPCNSLKSKVKISSRPQLPGLKGFDHKLDYSADKVTTDAKGEKHYYVNGREFKVMKATQKEMGVVSNLITDMTLLGAKPEELARAVKHSMVVIDAEKHKLDYKRSESVNGIAALKNRYQGTTTSDGKYHEGAATLLSRAKSQTQVLKRQGSPSIDEKTGELVWKLSDKLHYTVEKKNKKTGEVTIEEKTKHQRSTKMAEAKNAYDLISEASNPKERRYADYANKMKSLANQARKEMVNTGKIPYDAAAKKTYQNEVDSLMAKLNVALKNAPKERLAQVKANAVVESKKKQEEGLSKKDIKKISQQALTESRAMVGAKREAITVTDREWEAIQSGAITENKLKQIINNMDIDELRQRATPRSMNELSPAKISKIASMRASGYTLDEIAKSIGTSASTVSNYLK